MTRWAHRLSVFQGRYRGLVDRSSRLLGVGAASLALAAGCHLGRVGQSLHRLAGALLIAFGLLLIIIHAWWQRRRLDPQGIVRKTIVPHDPERGRATLRALDLQRRTIDSPEQGSAALAELHLERTLQSASLERVERGARRSAARRTGLAALAAAVLMMSVLHDPLRVIEGANVIAARNGLAPLRMKWIEEISVGVQPPAHLGRGTQRHRRFVSLSLPEGSRLDIRAVGTYDGRSLGLTDGTLAVPFRREGDGQLVARWTLTKDSRLRVYAQFGDVRIEEPRAIDLHSIADLRPKVTVEDAPRVVRLIDTPRIPVHYEARDDHALHEVDLVMQSGRRTERRQLSRPQGARKYDRGGTDLLASDPFLRAAHLPIVVTVQARDGDPTRGPKWGESEAITLLPPTIGERHALRYAALKRSRDDFVDALALNLAPTPDEAASRDALDAAQSRLSELLVSPPKGALAVPARIGALLGQQSANLPTTRTRLVTTKERFTPLEQLVITIDAALNLLGDQDARQTAAPLAEATEQLAQRIAKERLTTEVAAPVTIETLLGVVERGGEQLIQLGELGRDLGEIVSADVRRIKRSLQQQHLMHAELAARDLAARLRQPVPSFQSSGGGGGGTESGSGQGAPPVPDQADEISALDQALRQLQNDHRSQLDAVEQALKKATDEARTEEQKQANRQAAKAIRQAVRSLPRQAAVGSTAEIAAQGRSEAEQAARSLEDHDLKEATSGLKRSIEALKQAARGATKPGANRRDQETAKQAAAAQAQLNQLLRDLKEQMRRAERAASSQIEDTLKEAAKQESQLAERAKHLRQLSDESGIPIAGDRLQKIAEAASEMTAAGERLRRGDGSAGLKAQRKAQQLLDMAAAQGEQRRARQSQDNGKNNASGDANVPKKAKEDPTKAFRRKVAEGLKRNIPPRLRPAVERYAEDLMK